MYEAFREMVKIKLACGSAACQSSCWTSNVILPLQLFIYICEQMRVFYTKRKKFSEILYYINIHKIKVLYFIYSDVYALKEIENTKASSGSSCWHRTTLWYFCQHFVHFIIFNPDLNEMFCRTFLCILQLIWLFPLLLSFHFLCCLNIQGLLLSFTALAKLRHT